MNEEQLLMIQRFRAIDDIFFEVLANDKAFCAEMLQTILCYPLLEVKEVKVQSSLRNLYGRSVRLDALCTLEDGTECNIEVQRSDDDDHLRRARYNASVITTRDTDVGTRFEKVPNVIIVYITEFDFLKEHRTIYHIGPVIGESGRKVDDGLSMVFVNTAIDDGSDVAEYMQCMMQPNVESELFPQFTRRVHEIKDTEGGKQAMCQLMEEYTRKVGEQQRREGRREQAEASKRQLARNLKARNPQMSEAEALKEAEALLA